jgi:murein L,D-transpeptidase YcbB/YkuD
MPVTRIAAVFIAALCSSIALSQVPTAAPPQEAVKQLLEEANPAYLDQPTSLTNRERVGMMYQAQGYRMLWSDGAKPTAAAVALVHELQGAADRGLDPADYSGERLASVLSDLAGRQKPEFDEWALFDVSVSLAGVRFLSDLHFGRIDPATVGHNLSVGRANLDVPAALARIASASDVAAALDALEPPFKHYALLKRELAHYRALAAEPGINDLPALPGKSVKPGGAYSGADQLQRLLMLLGDAPGSSAAAPNSLTPALVDALEHFQVRHGEKPDGVLGAATFAELVRPLGERVRQIELTMERWRWLPSVVNAPIIVNIPQFRLFAFESNSDSESLIRQMDVIVGKAFEATQTPVFAADMTYLIFRPYWEVPYSIAVKEIVPGARRNPASIEKHQMEIVRGGGDSAVLMPNTAENVELVAKGQLRLRQKPGPNNSLGLVKFMFPNAYNVYLHSTPAQALFNESRRDFSHGCVRVSDPVGLAQFVLRDSPEWPREKIEAAMNGNSTITVTLKNRIRIFIVYGTALALEDGRILFFDDIYGHDQRLEAALNSRRPRPAPPTEQPSG